MKARWPQINCPACGIPVWVLRHHVRFWHQQPNPLMTKALADKILSGGVPETEKQT